MATKTVNPRFPLTIHVSYQDEDTVDPWLMVENEGVENIDSSEDGSPVHVALYKRISTGKVLTSRRYVAEGD